VALEHKFTTVPCSLNFKRPGVRFELLFKRPGVRFEPRGQNLTAGGLTNKHSEKNYEILVNLDVVDDCTRLKNENIQKNPKPTASYWKPQEY